MHISAGKLWGLRRMADRQGLFKMLAVDQRPPIKNLVKQSCQLDSAPFADVCTVKRLLVEALSPTASAALLDPHFAYPAAIDIFDPRCGLILTLENSIFEDTPEGRLSSDIEDWSVNKIKRAGGDAVKALAWYRPDSSSKVCQQQQDYVKRIGAECVRFDLPFVFELLLYPLPGEANQTKDYVEQVNKRADHVLASVETFAAADYGVDVFKLESPVNAKNLASNDADIQKLFDELGNLSARPWVMLSAGADQNDFKTVLEYAYRAGAAGYLAGRAIWWQALQHYPDIAAVKAALASNSIPYMQALNAMTEAQATPWFKHPLYQPEGPRLDAPSERFREHYSEL